jgi:hypothetical protein
MVNERPHDGAGQAIAPRACVCSDDLALAAVEREFVAAGWTSFTLPDLLSHPRRGEGVRPLGIIRLDTQDDIAPAADLLLQGVSVVVAASEPTLAADAFDQCRRLAAAEWFDRTHRPLADQLSDEQLLLLLAIRAGDDVEAAARRLHLSPRTAARRLHDARRALGARSTAEAVTLVGCRIDELRGGM